MAVGVCGAIAFSGSQEGEEFNPSKGSRPSRCWGLSVISSLLSGPPLNPLRLCDFALPVCFWPLCFWPLCLWGDQNETQRRKGAKRWSPIWSGSPRRGPDRSLFHESALSTRRCARLPWNGTAQTSMASPTAHSPGPENWSPRAAPVPDFVHLIPAEALSSWLPAASWPRLDPPRRASLQFPSRLPLHHSDPHHRHRPQPAKAKADACPAPSRAGSPA